MRSAVLVALLGAACVPSFTTRECFSDLDCPAPAQCRASACVQPPPDASLADAGEVAEDATAGDAPIAEDGARDAGALDAEVGGAEVGDGAVGDAAPDGAQPDAASRDALPFDSAFTYTPRNFDPAIGTTNIGPLTIRGACILNTQSGTFTSSPTPGMACAGAGPYFAILTTTTAIVHATSLDVEARARLTVTGSASLIFAIHGPVTIEGEIDLAARFGRSGPGANSSGACGPGRGRRGQNASAAARLVGGGGGGGGAFSELGGDGGSITSMGGLNPQVLGGTSGVPGASPDLVPLIGGCSGGTGGDGLSASLGGRGGGGGGAIQISSAGPMMIAGKINASGGGGRGGAVPGAGGGGGGSGGAILLEAPTLDLAGSARLLTTGGGGAGGANHMTKGEDGKVMEDRGGGGKGTDPAGDGGEGGGGPGAPGHDNERYDTAQQGGGGGGGGSWGRIILTVPPTGTCTRGGGAKLVGQLAGVPCR